MSKPTHIPVKNNAKLQKIQTLVNIWKQKDDGGPASVIFLLIRIYVLTDLDA